MKYKRAFLTVTLPSGENKRIAFYGKTQKEAEKKKLKAEAEYEAGLLIINSKTTFRKWYDEWIEVYKEPRVQKSTLTQIKSIMNRVYLPIIGNVKLCDLRTIHLQKCLNSVEGMSPKHINKCYVYIKDCLGKVPQGPMRCDPTRDLEKPKGKKNPPRRPLTEEERRVFRKAIEIHHRGDFFGIIYACGLRPQEARALPIFNINLKKGEIRVTQAVEASTRKTVKDPKSEAGARTIPIPDWYLPMLKNAIDKALNQGSPYVFPNKNGDIMSNSTMYRAWSSFLREMDIIAGAKLYRNKVVVHAIDQSLVPYNLRHNYGTELAEKGVPMKTAQYLMGHSDIRMTAEIYTHVTNAMIDEAREIINAK